MKFSKSMKETRENNNLNQVELAKLTGIKQQNISRWENGTAVPSIINCIKLADFYGITVDELIGHEVKKNW